MEKKKTFVAGSETAKYLESLIALNAWADPVFDLAVKEYGEDSEIVSRLSAALEELKGVIGQLMSYSVANSLSFKDNVEKDVIEI